MSIQSYILNATNVHISINDQWLDEAVSIAAQRQAGHQMVYGYMDVDPRRPIRGNAIVVGTLGVHHRSADYIQRYLINSPGFDRSREQAMEDHRNQLKEFKTDAELLAYMASFDLSSGDFDTLATAVEKNATNDPINDDDIPLTADAIGEEGFKASIRKPHRYYRHPTKNRYYVGNTIKIYYGDAKEENFAEAIYGVIFTGEAMSPLENTAGVSADPLMKFYSFIGARIDPVTRDPWQQPEA